MLGGALVASGSAAELGLGTMIRFAATGLARVDMLGDGSRRNRDPALNRRPVLHGRDRDPLGVGFSVLSMPSARMARAEPSAFQRPQAGIDVDVAVPAPGVSVNGAADGNVPADGIGGGPSMAVGAVPRTRRRPGRSSSRSRPILIELARQRGIGCIARIGCCRGLLDCAHAGLRYLLGGLCQLLHLSKG